MQTSEFEAPAVNGAVTTTSVAPAGPRIPHREDWLDLPEEYAGFKVKVWVNYPRQLALEMSSGEQPRIRAALLQIVREHNGWCDENGTPLPSASDPAFWDVLPDELAGVVVALLLVQVGKLGASIHTRSKR